MLVTVFEGEKGCGKSSHLIRCVLSRVRNKRRCWVFCRNDKQKDLLMDLLKNIARDSPLNKWAKNTGVMVFSNETTVKFAVLTEDWPMVLHSYNTQNDSLFVNDGDYSLDLQDRLLRHSQGWHEVMVTRTTGPEAPAQRTIH